MWIFSQKLGIPNIQFTNHKKSKKKRGRVKGSGGSGGGSKQRKELGSLEEDANPDGEGVQKASPLPHSPPDEL